MAWSKTLALGRAREIRSWRLGYRGTQPQKSFPACRATSENAFAFPGCSVVPEMASCSPDLGVNGGPIAFPWNKEQSDAARNREKRADTRIYSTRNRLVQQPQLS